MSMPRSRRAWFWTAFLVLAVSALALAPVMCATGCPGTTDDDADCVTTCDTALGYPAPWASAGWLAVPVAVLGVVAYLSVTRPRRHEG